MKKTNGKTIILAILFAGLCGGLFFLSGNLMPVYAADKPAAKGRICTLRSLEGTYEIGTTGSFVGVGPVATLGTIELDGKGNFEVTDTASFNGTIISRVGAGNYTVNPNCTGSATVTYSVGQPGRTATFNIVITERGADVRIIGTTVGGTVFGTAKLID